MNDYKEVINRIDLRSLVAPGKRIMNGKPVLINCPWHDDKHASLAIYPENCFCFGCGKRLSTLEWIAEKEGLNIDSQFREVVKAASKHAGLSDVTLPVKYPKRPPLLTPMSEEVAVYAHKNLGDKRQWYLDRGLTDTTIDAELLGYLNSAFAIPVWDSAGFLLTMRYRRDDSITKEGNKYWGTKGRNATLIYNEKILLEEYMQKYGRTVCLTESELDALLLWQEGISTIAFTNGVNAWRSLCLENLRKLDYVYHLIICFDQDDAGKKSAQDLKGILGERAVILQWEDYLGKDITELAQYMGINYVQQLIESADSSIHILGR